MSLPALLLVTISAFTHAFWNFLSKRQNPSAAFFLMASLFAVVLFSPALILFREELGTVPEAVWMVLLATGAVQAAYYIFLAAAYRSGELSLAYPLARSLPVVLIALVSVLLGRGEQIHAWAYPGFLAVTAGCLFLPLPDFKTFQLQHYRQHWVLFALLAAVCITAYTLLDDQALRILRALQGVELSSVGWALLYVELETISLTIFLAVFLLGRKKERLLFFTARLPEWRMAAITGFIITATYGLVLLAMTYARNVSYVAAFRQLSIPIGALMGVMWRKESAHPPKLIGIAVVVAGLILIAVS